MGKNRSEVRMKKIVLLFLSLLLLSGCVTTPNTVSIESTVQAAVNTAIAPYESKYNDFVTSNQLDESQKEQNEFIQNTITEQLELFRSSFQPEPMPTESPDIPASTVIEYSDGQIVPTDVPQRYTNDPTCVDRFTYVSDISIPDGMNITPYTNFTKSWYITNSGDCTWNSNYKLVYNSGAKVGQAESFSILKPGYFVQPGESIVVSAELTAPNNLNASYTTYWALQSDRGEVFGAGDAKNVFLSSNFVINNSFIVAQNFNSLTCYDNHGPIVCGSSGSGGRGAVYYDGTPMLESGRGGNPAIVVGPPVGEDDSTVRFEFGPLRFPRRSNFYMNFCCRPDTPHCDVKIRLLVKEAGYDWIQVAEEREWNDGFMGEWKYTLDDLRIFDQDFYYAVEVQANGGATDEDLIMITNFRIY